ncbi:MAG: hypothetical protein V4539_11300 [Bacteroidota bacterium]
MDSIFLLRAYGDCIIALTSMRNSPRMSSVELILSNHLEPLYHALPQEKLPAGLRLRFHDFGIKKGLMRCFTTKYLLHTDTVLELRALQEYIKMTKKENSEFNTMFLENKKRAWLAEAITGNRFGYIIDEENVYDAYNRFFQTHITEDPAVFNSQTPGLHVLLIPDARMKNKSIDPQLTEKIHHSFAVAGSTVTTAFFREAPVGFKNKSIVYRDFQELVNCINKADLIIGADSMPVHLCQFLEKPHYMLYPGHIRRYKRKQFFTPFVLRNGYYYSFEELHQRSSFFPNSTA